jgi:hypothetical protein
MRLRLLSLGALAGYRSPHINFCAQIPANAGGFAGWRGLPSPSCHIYNPLTMTVAFRWLGAFDRLRQGSVKVDGTFA